jgi:hypothetical protein
MIAASFLAVATAATWLPRRDITRMKNERKGPGTRDAAHAASTRRALAWLAPRFVIRPWRAGPLPDCRTLGFRPR